MSRHAAKPGPPPLPRRRRDVLTESGIEWHDATLLEDDLGEPIKRQVVPLRPLPPSRSSKPLPPPHAPWRPMPAPVTLLPPFRGPLPRVVAPVQPRALPLPSPPPSTLPPPPRSSVAPIPGDRTRKRLPVVKRLRPRRPRWTSRSYRDSPVPRKRVWVCAFTIRPPSARPDVLTPCKAIVGQMLE